MLSKLVWWFVFSEFECGGVLCGGGRFHGNWVSWCALCVVACMFKCVKCLRCAGVWCVVVFMERMCGGHGVSVWWCRH